MEEKPMNEPEWGTSEDNRRGGLAPFASPHQPPPHLERRITGALTARGLLSSRFGWMRRFGPILATAAGLSLFVAGRASVPASSAPVGGVAPAFMLLLLGDSAEQAMNPAGGDTSIAAHRAWVASLRAGGHTVRGERLAPDATIVGPGAASGRNDARFTGAPITGVFVISARDRAEAEAIARTSPHVRRGGRIIVRRIEPT